MCPDRGCWRGPHLYRPAEIQALISAACGLGPRGSLRPHTLATLIGLLASCGLQASEALRVRVADLALDARPPHLVIQ
jgi:integrase